MKKELGICSFCSTEFGEVVKFKTYNTEVDLCPRCVKEMYLLLNPINFKKENILTFMEATIVEVDLAIKNGDALNGTENNFINFIKFAQFVKTFLESK